jgi:hypothetical protein
MRGRWSRLAWPAGFAVGGIVLFLAYLLQSSRSTNVNSDGASNALQAWAMLHGNVLLHGWSLSDVSFYTTELPQYALVEAVRGLTPEVVHICGAMTYALLVVFAAVLAKGRSTGRKALVSVAVAASCIMTPQLGNPAAMVLLSPDHVGTGVPLLVIWILIDRTDWLAGPAEADGDGRPRRDGWLRWAVPAAVCLLLAWTAVGDQLAEVVAAVPLVLTCALRVLRARFRGVRLRNLGYELSLGVAAMLSVPLAWLGVKLVTALDGWTITAPRTGLAAPGVLGRNLSLTGSGLLQLFGADFFREQSGVEDVFSVIHMAGLALAACGLFLAVRRFFGQQLIVQVLTVAIAVNIAAYIFTVQAENIATTREIAAVLPFGAVLAGRLLADPLLGVRPEQSVAHARVAPNRLLAGSVAVLALFLCYGAMLGYNATRPMPAEQIPAAQVAKLASWLKAHGFTRGVGGYWLSNSVTLDTGGAVQVRAIDINQDELINGGYWEADSSWYDPRSAYADFVLTVPPPWHPREPGVLIRHMEQVAGKPVKIYRFDGYQIALWRQNLLTKLG